MNCTELLTHLQYKIIIVFETFLLFNSREMMRAKVLFASSNTVEMRRRAGKRMKKKKTHTKLGRMTIAQSYLMVAGSVIALIVFVVIPLIWIVRFCVLKYPGYGTARFV